MRKITASMAQSERTANEMVRRIIEAHQKGDVNAFQSLVPRAVSELVDAWDMPRDFTHSELSLGDDSTLWHFHFVHAAEREKQLH